MFTQWLNDPKNEDFKALYDSRSEIERSRLYQHIMTPWLLMDFVSKNSSPGQDWDLQSEGVSCYIYPSMIGGGWISAFVVAVLQLCIPPLLLYGQIFVSSKFTVNSPSNITTSVEEFCGRNGRVDSLVTNILVLVFYAIRQVPKVAYAFFEASGEAGTPLSKLAALRKNVWDVGRDSLGMQFGYKLNKYMDSFYTALVNTIMLFILYLTPDSASIILNASKFVSD